MILPAFSSGSRIAQPRERPDRLGLRLARGLGGGEGALPFAEEAHEVARQIRRRALEIDHGVALQDAEPCRAALVECHQPHVPPPCTPAPARPGCPGRQERLNLAYDKLDRIETGRAGGGVAVACAVFAAPA